MLIRDYQAKAIDAVADCLSRGRRPILVMPTGGGKTFTAAQVVKRLNLRTLWMAHKRELIAQARSALTSLGLSVGTILAGYPHYANRQVQVASVQTLSRRAAPEADLIIWDEVHHCASKSWGRIFKLYPNANHVGLTATPWRLDGRALGECFDEIVVGAYAEELLRTPAQPDGVLIEPRVYAPPPESLAGVGKRGGDFDKKKLASVIDKPKLVGDIVTTWQQHAAGRLTACYAVNIEHSQHIVAQFRAAGIPAEHVDGTMTTERDAALDRLRRREILIVSNCQCLHEGWDLPELECEIIARPTASLCLHIQMAGRVMRIAPGKTDAVILDHSGNFLRFGRVTKRFSYTLEGGAATTEPSGLRTCPKCFRMVLSGRPKCPECGLDFSTVREERELPQTIDGRLEEYRDPEVVAAEEDRKRNALWFQLAHVARKNRHRPAWVSHEFKRRTGEWRDCKPIEHIVLGVDAPQSVEELLNFGAA